jgi:Fe-S-cluster containining protein
MSKHPLHENIDQFFILTSSANSEQMECKSGCAKCCYTDISIFGFEAQIIIDWFKRLDSNKQSDLIKFWNLGKGPGPDLENIQRDPCVFLYEDKCTIYDARATICRSQGLALLVDDEISHCPLNFKELPDKKYWLDLNRLNTLVSLAQSKYKGDIKRISLTNLKDKLIRDFHEKI